MKITKFTSALIGLGILSAASVAQATNPVVYLSGASVLRSTLFTVLTAAGNTVFDGGVAGTVKAGTPTSANAVFEGPVNGATTDISIFWTGAEAGVANVAGNLLTQTLNNPGLGGNAVG